MINPFSWTRDGRPPFLPYGILYLASYLKKQGIEVGIHDCNASNSRVEAVLRREKPEWVGISVLTGKVIKEAIAMTKIAKRYSKVIWGGLHPTLFPEYCRKAADHIITGEGEYSLYELLINKYQTNRLINLDDNPMPAFELVNIRKYITNKGWASRVLTLNTSRGCIFKCSFCQNQGLPYRRWRGLSAENICKQIKYLKENYRINGIYFYEDCFDADKQRVIEFCELVKPLKIKWGHSSSIALCDEKVLKQEKLSGLAYIDYGVESGNNRILELLNKKQTAKQIFEVYEICKKLKLKTGALFMLGLPTETEKELNETIHLIERLHVDMPICTIYKPYPKTPLHDLINFHAPKTLEEQADFYNYSDFSESIRNVSNISTKKLLKIQSYFHKKAVRNEILYNLKKGRVSYLCQLLYQRITRR